MNKLEIITKLKDKNTAQAFGLCSPEEKAMFKKVGKGNCLCLCDTGVWDDLAFANRDFYLGITHVIKPDWEPEPEPEYDDSPVSTSKDGFCRIQIPRTRDTWNVMVAASDKDFEEYWYLFNGGRHVIPPERVSAWMADGRGVFGRFRKS